MKSAITKCKKLASAKSILSHIRYLKTSSTAVALGSYPDTAIKTERRQRHSKGSTHIKDKNFEFFLTLEKERLELHTTPYVIQHDPNVMTVAYQTLLEILLFWVDFVT